MEIGRREGIWAAMDARQLAGLQAQDRILFVHDLKSDIQPPPRGFPYVGESHFRGIASTVLECDVTSAVYEDSTPVWPERIYPFRFRFSEVSERSDVLFAPGTTEPALLRALHRSTMGRGRPFVAMSALDERPALALAMKRQARMAELADSFDPSNPADARQRVATAIVLRRGQPAFRQALLKAYGRRCAVTGCDLVEALEAAHIVPYRGSHTNVVSNGLLLRADVHTLFDLGLFTFDPSSLNVIIHSSLIGSSYEWIQHERLRLPADPRNHPIREALAAHKARTGIV